LRPDPPSASIGTMSVRRHVVWVAVAATFAVAILPALVFYTGTRLLGPYAGGGLRDFYGDFLRDLAGLELSAWVLLFGPVALVAVWRLLVAGVWPRTGA
jgi:hypothetical protein